MVQNSTSNNISFGKNTLYLLDIDNTFVKTGKDALVKIDGQLDKKLLGYFDKTDVVVFNTGRPKADIPKVLSVDAQDKATSFITRMGTAIWKKLKNGTFAEDNAWKSFVNQSGFDDSIIRKIVQQKQQILKDSQIVIKEYNEPFSHCMVIEYPKSKLQKYMDFQDSLNDELKSLKQAFSMDVHDVKIEQNATQTFDSSSLEAAKNGQVVEGREAKCILITPEKINKGIASEFVIDRMLKQFPWLNRIFVAGDSVSDLASFLINIPSNIKGGFFAFVNPMDKKFFSKIYEAKRIQMPKIPETAERIPFGYYPETNMFVPQNNPEVNSAPQGLIESLEYFK